MNIFIMIIFSIIGICSGIAIPAMSDRIVIYKSHKGKIETTDRNYGHKINVFVILLNAGLWIYAWIRLENVFTAFLISFLFTVLILISFIDFRIRLIPNELILLLLCLGILFQILCFSWINLFYALLCMAAAGSVFVVIGRFAGFEQIGAGDVKLIAAIGMVLGYPYIKVALIGMSSALLVFCLGGLAVKKLTMQSTFPFAPFIMFGAVCALIDVIGMI